MILPLVLAGCGSGITSPGPPSQVPPTSTFTFSGKIQEGQVSITGASVQLYVAGTTGNGLSSLPLLTNAVVTDTSGAFSVPVTYSCPSATSMLYVIAKGGKLASAVSDNASIWLMAPIGLCSSTTTVDTSIVLNEVTTAASVWALSPFLSRGGNVGASSTNSQGLMNAMSTAANLVNLHTGTVPGAGLPSNVKVATAKLNTLANVLASCVSSPGGTGCAALFSSATVGGITPTNTLDAAFNIVRNPGANVATVYALSTANPVFQPALPSAPPDWLLYNTISGGGLNSPEAVAIDGSGNVWVSNFYDVLSEFAPTGAPVSSSGITGYGINQSYGMTLDAGNNVWIANEQTRMNSGSGDVTKLSSSGESLSGASGFSAGDIDFPIGIAADPNGNIWVGNHGDSTITLLDSNGNSLSGSGFAGGYLAFPVAVAVDANHNAWVANSVEGAGFVTRISTDGSKVANIYCCDGVAGIAVDQVDDVWATNFNGSSISLIANASSSTPDVHIFTGGGIDAPNGIAIDGAGTAWVTNYLGNNLSTVTEAASTALSGSGFGNDADLSEPYAVAIDSSGSIWISNAGRDTVTEFIGAAIPVKTPLVGPPQLP